MKLTINDVVEEYDYLKSDEAKQMFLDLGKIDYIRKEKILDEEDIEELSEKFFKDERKLALVKKFVTIGWAMKEALSSASREITGCDKFREGTLRQVLVLKEELDPEYIYEKWGIEEDKMFDKLKLNGLFDDDFSEVEFLEWYKI